MTCKRIPSPKQIVSVCDSLRYTFSFLSQDCISDPYPYSEQDVRDSEETILYHLSKSTQYNLTEEQVVANCRVSI